MKVNKQMPLPLPDKCLRAIYEAAIWEWQQYNPNAKPAELDDAATAIKQDLGLI